MSELSPFTMAQVLLSSPMVTIYKHEATSQIFVESDGGKILEEASLPVARAINSLLDSGDAIKTVHNAREGEPNWIPLSYANNPSLRPFQRYQERLAHDFTVPEQAVILRHFWGHARAGDILPMWNMIKAHDHLGFVWVYPGGQGSLQITPFLPHEVAGMNSLMTRGLMHQSPDLETHYKEAFFEVQPYMTSLQKLAIGADGKSFFDGSERAS